MSAIDVNTTNLPFAGYVGRRLQDMAEKADRSGGILTVV
jgi:uncharacterized protein (DUF3820 family)